MGTSKRVEVTGINRWAVRLQKLFYEVTFFFSKFQSSTSNIEILVGVNVFVEHSKSLLPTLGRSANLNEPWAPRKELSRIYTTFEYNICNTLSNFKLL